MAKSAKSSTNKDMTDKERIARLESLISRLAVMTGQGNLLPEFGIERWEPSKKDMSKYK